MFFYCDCYQKRFFLSVENRIVYNTVDEDNIYHEYSQGDGCPSKLKIWDFMGDLCEGDEKNALIKHIRGCIKCIEIINETKLDMKRFTKRLMIYAEGDPRSIDVIEYLDNCAECYLAFVQRKGIMEKKARNKALCDEELVDYLYNLHLEHYSTERKENE